MSDAANSNYFSAELIKLARTRYGDQADRWLNSPNVLLALRTPLQALLEFKPEEVLDALALHAKFSDFPDNGYGSNNRH